MPREALGSIGDYELQELVGRGGMAQVYRARHKRSGEIYALKVLIGPAVLDDTIAARFRREAEVIQTISHPCVVRLIDFGTTPDQRNYLVMEWVEGRPLSDAISREAPFAPARAGDIARKIAGGLGVIHAHDFVHRDLKPQNILLTGEHEEALKIVDFGLVTGDIQLWEKLTRTGEIVGTPLYMAPESIEGKAVDPRTDLYSLGVILYEMLAGDVPFASPSIPEILDRHLSAKPPRLKKAGGLENIAIALLEKSPAMRYIDSNAVIAAIDALDLATQHGIPDITTHPGTPKTNRALTSTVAHPQTAKTAEGPLTQPYPVQTWTGVAAEVPDPSDTSSPETIRIPLGRTDTDLETSDEDDTGALSEPTRSLKAPAPPRLEVPFSENPLAERTASFDKLPMRSARRDSTPRPMPAAAQPSAREGRRKQLEERRRMVTRVLFFVFGAIITALALHLALRRSRPIEIQVPPSRPRAIARPVDSSTISRE